jgi:ATP-dependent Clp protease protease subunit
MSKFLLDLLAANQAAPRSYVVKAAADDTAEVMLYDAIGGWFGVDAKQFASDLAAVTKPNIVLRINSPGGDVFDARAMATAIKAHPAKITARIEGLCASAATYIALACAEVEMAAGAFFMIHDPWTMAIGSAPELRDTADLLDKVQGTIAADYAAKSGKSLDEVKSLMAAETWYTGQEALDAGFVDRLIDAPADTAQASAWNVAAYKNAPQALSAPLAPAEPDRALLKRRAEALIRSHR